MNRIRTAIFVLILIPVLLAGVLFYVRNRQIVALDFYLTQADVNVALALVIALSLGALLGLCASVLVILRLKRQIRRLKRTTFIARAEPETDRSLSVLSGDVV